MSDTPVLNKDGVILFKNIKHETLGLQYKISGRFTSPHGRKGRMGGPLHGIKLTGTSIEELLALIDPILGEFQGPRG